MVLLHYNTVLQSAECLVQMAPPWLALLGFEEMCGS